MLPVVSGERAEFLEMAAQYFSELNSAFVPEDDWKKHYFEDILGNRQYFLRWIMCEQRRAGFILFGVENHRFLRRKTGVIYELYVLREFRREGVARICAAEAIRELWTHSPSKIQLEVVDGDTAAVALWKSLGFEKATERFVLTRGKL